ncbi:cytochrome c3 family protein [Spirochaetota bacterium]
MKRYNTHIFTLILIVTGFGMILYSQGGKKFEHKNHGEEAELKCQSCHKDILKSTKADDNNLPDKKGCEGECHKAEVVAELKFTLFEPYYKFNFNHSKHGTTDEECKSCHSDLDKDDYESGDSIPEMSDCFTCHNNQNATKQCDSCHIEQVPFSHFTHLEKNTECKKCHGDVSKNMTVVKSMDIETKQKLCDKCHEKKEKYASVTKFNEQKAKKYTFNHYFHVTKKGMKCKECHGEVYKDTDFNYAKVIPKKPDCFKCHDNKKASQTCSLCHKGSVMPEDHLLGWDKQHKVKANNDLQECLSCHSSRTFCTKCHNGPVSFFVHGSNYEILHKYDARISTKSCTACHSDRQCKNCHLAKGLHPGNNFRQQHPAGWNDITSLNHHKRKARTKLTNCTVCHTRNDCIRCHFTKMR